jgi:hypothetical protein
MLICGQSHMARLFLRTRPTAISASERAGDTLASTRPPAYHAWPKLLMICCLALALSGCLLTSGERLSADTLADGGNISTSFIGAEGSSERSAETGAPGAKLNAIVIVQAERGGLRVELLNADGNVAFSVQSRPDEQVTRRGDVTTDAQGRLRYRVVAQGVRNGGYQVLYQRVGAGG